MFPKFDQFLQSETEMASSLALKRLVCSNLLSRSLHPARPAASVAYSRFFNTNVARQYEDVDDIDDGKVDRRSNPVLYSRRDLSPFSGSRNPPP